MQETMWFICAKSGGYWGGFVHYVSFSGFLPSCSMRFPCDPSSFNVRERRDSYEGEARRQTQLSL